MSLSGSGRVNPEKQIGEYWYRCAPLRGEDMLDVMVVVCRALSPLGTEELIGSLLSGQTGQAQAAAVSALGGSLQVIFRELRSEDVQDIRRRFARVTEVQRDGKTLALDGIFGEHFAGRPSEILQWLVHAFSVSFPLFFSGSSASPDHGPGAATGAASRSPSTSRGSSGGS